LTKSWLADLIFPFLFDFYKDSENLLNKRFFFPQSIYRPFISVEEQNEWVAQSGDVSIKNFVENIFLSSAFGLVANDPFGGIVIKQSGYVNVKLFMQRVSGLLMEKHSYREEYFDFKKLETGSDKIIYQDLEATNIIFCDGFRATENPFFNWLPIRPLKGETLSVFAKEIPDIIFNRGVYLAPTGRENSYVIGATYQPGTTNEGITSEARVELEEKVAKLIKMPFEIDHQYWGIRPTTPDRRPILGSHPRYKNVIIFNGLGTKGVSLAPYFSNVLMGWMKGEIEIPKEVNIERFKALYSGSSSV